MIGKRDEIPDLLRSWRREDRYLRERIGNAIRTIMRRERIRRNHPSFAALGDDSRRVLDTLLQPAAMRRATRGRPARRKRPG